MQVGICVISLTMLSVLKRTLDSPILVLCYVRKRCLVQGKGLGNLVSME